MPESQDSYTLADYITALKRRRHILKFVALPIGAIAIAIALLLPDSYESTALIDINLEGSNVETLEPIAVSSYADQYISKLRERVLTPDNLSLLAQDGTVFSGDLAELSESDRRELIRDGVIVSIVTQSVMSDGRPVDLISGFRTGFAGPDPEFAYDVAVFLSDKFMQADRANRTERASSTSSFLRDQIRLTETEIVALEKQIAEFKVKNACCLPELKELNMSVIERAERDIDNLQPRLRALEQDRIFLQARLEEIRKQSISTDRISLLEEQYISLVANYGPDHPDVARVRRELSAISDIDNSGNDGQELVNLRIELAEKERRYSEVHPDVISLKRRIASLETNKTANVQKGKNRLLDNPRYIQLRSEINAIDTELSALQTRRPELLQKIAEYEDRLIRTPQIESEYQALSRKLESGRDNYDNLQQRLVIARQTEALESTEIGTRLIEVASPYVPSAPSGPPRLAISVLGLFLAVSLGIGSVIITELMDSTVRSSKDIIRAIQIVPIAAIPTVQNSASLAKNHRLTIMVVGVTVLLIVAIMTTITS